MLWRDLREYLARLEAIGELKIIRGANWEEEIGAISELITERQGPSLLFDEIPGYPKGFRVASNLFTTTRRTGIAVGMGEGEDLGARWSQAMRQIRPLAPEEVATGPILENMLTGDAVDLLRFPTPKWHELDGGRYIGTGVCVIQKDPDTGFVNVGAYRVSIHDQRTCGLFIEHGKDGDIIRRKFWERGQKCPVVVSVGQEPVLTALAGSGARGVAEEISELEIAGYLHGSPYPVVRGEITGIPIPAYSEIAIEGFIPSPQEAMALEGPFGEWTGYYAHGRRPETIIEVAAIYYRNDPIIFGAPPLRPVGCRYFTNFGGGGDVRSRLERAGVPGVQRSHQLASPALQVVALKQMYPGHVDDVIRVLAPGGDQYRGHNFWVLVDEDIDPSDPNEVLWAIASRCTPETGAVTVIPGTAVWQLDPRIPPDGRSDPSGEGRERYRADDMVINACRPYAWIDQFPPVVTNSPELRQRTLDKWHELFA